MKIGQVELEGPAEEVLVLPRISGDIVIRARAVLDMSPFEAMCPEPVPARVLVKGGFKEDTTNGGYLQQVAARGEKRFAYICYKSLEPSEIEWDTVVEDDHHTWENWATDLTNAGLSSVELNRIIVCVMQANCLDENKLERARESFLLGQEVSKLPTSGPGTELKSTPSGEPVVE